MLALLRHVHARDDRHTTLISVASSEPLVTDSSLPSNSRDGKGRIYGVDNITKPERQDRGVSKLESSFSNFRFGNAKRDAARRGVPFILG